MQRSQYRRRWDGVRRGTFLFILRQQTLNSGSRRAGELALRAPLITEGAVISWVSSSSNLEAETRICEHQRWVKVVKITGHLHQLLANYTVKEEWKVELEQKKALRTQLCLCSQARNSYAIVTTLGFHLICWYFGCLFCY